jgi:hypothetical protein
VWVIVRQADWVGGEDVIGVVGPFTTQREAQARLARMQCEIERRLVCDELLWLMHMEPVS